MSTRHNGIHLLLSTIMCSAALVYILCALSLLISTSHGFVIPHESPRSSSWRLQISFGGANKSEAAKAEFPKDVKDAVSKCRAAVQEALGQRISRMDIEFPVGAKFGVEKQQSAKKQRKQQQANTEDGAPTKAVLDTSDRELARLFVDMFQPVGGEHIAVVFSGESLAEQARKSWKGDATASCRILSTGRSKKLNTKKKKPQGFAAKMEAEVGNSAGPFELPEGIEVALFVAPGPKQLLQVEKTCNKVGMETLVVLLNARLSLIDNFGSENAEKLFHNEFVPVFSLCAAPQDVAPACLLHRTYPSDWLLARKPKVGQPKVILTTVDRPTEEECKQAYDSIELSDMEKNVEGVLENVAGWFA